jgi:hypothetical protein
MSTPLKATPLKATAPEWKPNVSTLLHSTAFMHSQFMLTEVARELFYVQVKAKEWTPSPSAAPFVAQQVCAAQDAICSICLNISCQVQRCRSIGCGAASQYSLNNSCSIKSYNCHVLQATSNGSSAEQQPSPAAAVAVESADASSSSVQNGTAADTTRYSACNSTSSIHA